MIIWCRLGVLLMDWCRSVVVWRWCMGCSDGEFGMVWGSPVLCSQQGSFSVMRLCVFCWVSGFVFCGLASVLF